MPDVPLDEDDQAALDRIVEKCGLESVKRFLEHRSQRRGRPTLADEVALSRMADYRYLKTVKSDAEAAALVIDIVPGKSEDAKIDRLRRKFRKDRERLMAEARERHKPATKKTARKAAPTGPLPTPHPLGFLEQGLREMEAGEKRFQDMVQTMREAEERLRKLQSYYGDIFKSW
jgi:hypothetical protein